MCNYLIKRAFIVFLIELISVVQISFSVLAFEM